MRNFCLKFFAALIVVSIFFKTGSKATNAGEPVFFIPADTFITLYTSEPVKDKSVFINVKNKPGKENKIKLRDFDFTNPDHMVILRTKTQKNKKLTAFALAVLLGHFGVHRLYLGTKPIVPISYVLTLGGGIGIIPAIDAVLILTAKDLEKYENNSRFFMWIN